MANYYILKNGKQLEENYKNIFLLNLLLVGIVIFMFFYII
jgi:hypothetical protein